MRIVQEIDRHRWSDFVYHHPDGNIFQTPEMFEVYRNTLNYEPFFISVIDKRGEILAILLSVVQREYKGFVGQLTARSIVLGGPLVKDNNTEVLELLLMEYDKIAGEKAIYSQFRNLYDIGGFSDVFEGSGYTFRDHLDIIVDLTKPVDLLWRELHPTRRKQVKRAGRRGIRVEALEDLGDLERFYLILLEVYKSARLPLAHRSMFEAAGKVLNSRGMIKYFVAMNDEIAIGVRFVLAYRDRLYDWYAGSLREYLNKYPNDILPWEVFKWGKEMGYKIFDFGGAGSPDRKYGVRDYKKKFGGRIVNYGRLEKIHRPLRFAVAKTGFKIWEIRGGF